MRIRTFLFIFFAITLGLVATDLAISYQLEAIEKEIQKAETQRRELLGLADELRMSSEFLTRFARRYAVTKDDAVLVYYNDILAIRDGKIALPNNYNGMFWDLVAAGLLPPPDNKESSSPSLLDRFVRAGVTTKEMEKLTESKVNSDNLARLERSAIHAARGVFDDGTETFQIKKKPDEKLAIKILNDKGYLENKALVVKPISDLITLITDRVNSEIASRTKKSAELVRINSLTATILISMLSLAVGYVFHRIWLRSAALLVVVKNVWSASSMQGS